MTKSPFPELSDKLLATGSIKSEAKAEVYFLRPALLARGS